MNYNLIFELPCKSIGKTKTITSKNGKSYDYRMCNFSDGLREINGAALFANEDGSFPELRVGDTYRVQMIKYYDRENKVEKEIFKVL